MNSRLQSGCLPILVTAGLVFLPGPEAARAQAVTNLYPFSPLNSQFVNADGAFPAGGLVSSSNTLYGTTSQGGNAGGGTVFRINIDGTGFKPIYNFTPANPNTGLPGDGAYPLAALVLGGSTLYGTTSAGGVADNGILFKINVDGTGFNVLHGFSATDPNTYANSDGAAPWAGLLLSSNTLYGTASRGGDAGSGTVFKLNTDGTGFTRLHSFSALDAATQTNSDGAYPLGSLIIASGALYGTTYRGGSLGTGTVFTVNTDGTGFRVLLDSDGGPRAGLLMLSNVLYGTTEAGGSSQGGTVFRLNPDGSGFTNIVEFGGSAGAGPWAGLGTSGNILYGTTYGEGDFGQGSVFTVNTDGSDLTNLYSFTGGFDGAHVQAGLILSGSTVYGTASEGGSSGDGTVFGVSIGQMSTPQLTINAKGVNVVLSWPANATGTLKSTTSLVPPVNWTVVTPGPVVVNGQNNVTNTIAVTQRFYMLSQ